MRIGKLWMAAVLAAMPVAAYAQGIDVRADVGIDGYDSTAPGAPVESVDVFYDQLSPYGVWVDEPDLGRVFIPDQTDYVPYRAGHWMYTSLGFVWVSSEPFGWATAHYGRWALSSTFGRWIWAPDTQWGPAWVEWRQTGADFGWAPLAPESFVRIGYQPPIESWRYCAAEHVLDVDVTRYYEPRDRVVVIHRDARPIEHYTNVSNVRVVVGPPATVLRDHRVTARPVKVEARTIGRWTPTEAHALVAKAEEHKATFEVQNQRRVEQHTKIRDAQVKVVETHPAIKAQVTARSHAAEPKREEPGRRVEPKPEPQRVEPKVPAHNESRPEPKREPQRVEPKAPAPRPEPQRAVPKPEPQRVEPKAPAPRPEPQRAVPKPEPQRVEPKPPAHNESRPEPKPAPRPEPQRVEPKPSAHTDSRPEPKPAARPEPQRAEPKHAEPKAPPQNETKAPPAQHPEPPHGNDKHK